MAPPPLPLECLQLIIQSLAHQGHAGTLSSFLCVSRYFAAATLPILYSSPFQNNFHAFRSMNTVVPSVTALKLVKMLLSTLTAAENASLLFRLAFMDATLDNQDLEMVQQASASTEIQARASTATTLFDYLSYIRHFDFSLCLISRVHVMQRDCILGNPDVDRYIEQPSFKNLHGFHQLPMQYLRSQASEKPALVSLMSMALLRELTTLLCFPRLEQIQKMSIPLSEIDKYEKVVHRLGSLQSVDFILDEFIQFPLEVTEQLIWHDFSVFDALQKKNSLAFSGMHEFVLSHTLKYRDLLQAATCPSSYFPGCTQTFPEEEEYRMLALLPPLNNLTVLDETKWHQFVAMADYTEVDRIKSITTPKEANFWSNRLCEKEPFLECCRSLQSVDMMSFGSDCFEWAVKQKDEFPPEKLAPVRNVILSGHDMRLVNELDHIAYGFSNTLETLDSSAWKTEDFWNVSLPPALAIGDQWDLPRVTSIRVAMFSSRLHIHPDFYSRMPLLQKLQLEDCVEHYDPQLIEYSRPGSLPSLKALLLMGTPAVAFHPDTLKNTPALEKLYLGMKYQDAGTFIADPETLQGLDDISLEDTEEAMDPIQDSDSGTPLLATNLRPRWSWDWHLPHLKTLSLMSEFAFRFQFRMLRNCPALEFLGIDSSTYQGLHLRTLTPQEFYPPRNRSSSRKNSDPLSLSSLEDDPALALTLPHLRALEMKGRWHLSEGVLPLLFGRLAPNLEILDERDCTGFTFEDWLGVLKDLPRLETVRSCRETPPPEELAQLGLASEEGAQEEEDLDPRVAFSFNEGRKYHWTKTLSAEGQFTD